MKLMAGKSLKHRIREETGFTLIELMVVIVILGILAALVLPRVIGSVTTDARKNGNQTNIQLIQTAVDRFAADTGQDCPNLTALTDKPDETKYPDWKGPYISKVPEPPKGFKQYVINPTKKIVENEGGTPDNGTPDNAGTGGQ